MCFFFFSTVICFFFRAKHWKKTFSVCSLRSTLFTLENFARNSICRVHVSIQPNELFFPCFFLLSCWFVMNHGRIRRHDSNVALVVIRLIPEKRQRMWNSKTSITRERTHKSRNINTLLVMRTESVTRTKPGKMIRKCESPRNMSIENAKNVRHILINITLHVAIFYAIIIKYFSKRHSTGKKKQKRRESIVSNREFVVERIRAKKWINLWQFGMAFSNHLLIFRWRSVCFGMLSVTYPIFITVYTHRAHIQWTQHAFNGNVELKRNATTRRMEAAKWQPMSSIFCCLDRIYITLTRARHKLDHTNQLTGCVFFLLFIHHHHHILGACPHTHRTREWEQFSRLATLWPKCMRHSNTHSRSCWPSVHKAYLLIWSTVLNEARMKQ